MLRNPRCWCSLVDAAVTLNVAFNCRFDSTAFWSLFLYICDLLGQRIELAVAAVYPPSGSAVWEGKKQVHSRPLLVILQNFGQEILED